MTSEDRDDLELGAHAAWAFLHDENHGTEAQRLDAIRNRFPEARSKAGPNHRRPKHIRVATILAGFGLAVGLTACIPVPPDVQIGDPLRVTAPDPIVQATCPYPGLPNFRWYGPASIAPEGCLIVGPADVTVPLLQTPITKPAK